MRYWKWKEKGRGAETSEVEVGRVGDPKALKRVPRRTGVVITEGRPGRAEALEASGSAG